jgi:hypothetical protein
LLPAGVVLFIQGKTERLQFIETTASATVIVSFYDELPPSFFGSTTVSALPSGGATSAKQDTGNASLASIDGKITAVNTGAVVVSSSALPTAASTSAKQDTGNTSLASIDGKITAVNTGAVVISGALPAGTAIIGKVTTDQATHGTTDLVAATGNVANAATDAGFPLKIGGKGFSGTPTPVTDGQRVDAWFGLYGEQFVTLATALSGTVDAVGTFHYNGSASELDYGNWEGTALASAARTASVNSADLTNFNARGVTVTIDCTANASALGVTAALQYKDTLSGKYVTLLTSATLFAATATGTVSLVIYPGTTVSANLSVSAPLPRVWRVAMTHLDADSITYSASANYIG